MGEPEDTERVDVRPVWAEDVPHIRAGEVHQLEDAERSYRVGEDPREDVGAQRSLEGELVQGGSGRSGGRGRGDDLSADGEEADSGEQGEQVVQDRGLDAALDEAEGADVGGRHERRESEHTLGGQAELVQTRAVGEEKGEVGDGLGRKDDVEDADVVK